MEKLNALVVEQSGSGTEFGVKAIGLTELPTGELLVRVAYSSVNYKDALACSPDGNVARINPLVPGIDLAGVVVSSESDAFAPGDEIVVTGFELGVSHYGGFAEFARVRADWAVKLPQGLTLREAMIYGTAGFTAAMSVLALQENGVKPGKGPVLVTGATGGVGSVSVAILAKLGYEIVASTGKKEAADELLRLGASKVIGREELLPEKPRPLDKMKWAGAIDCVGGPTLAAVLGAVSYGGAVAASGLTGGADLPTTVYPFILRGVRLIGIDSVFAPMELRIRVWDALAGAFKPEALATLATEVGMAEVPDILAAMLAGRSRGRVIVNVSGKID
ncbi:oxidoreductase [Cohnella soli]|uniref:Oxidoreductase n=1 Tax=Cohnella soli TaxID=425005 RepID=A0ABW0I463_9BACL